MAVVKYKEGTLDALSNGWEQTYTLRLYKDTVLSEDGSYSDFTEATGTNYVSKTLLWADATVQWNAVESKYEAVWPQQTWSSVSSLDADGWFISDSGDNRVYGAEEVVLGTDYSSLGATPKILMG